MICTCTMNPSLDYYMEFEKPVQPDSVNRSQLEYYEAGGKGINVSIVLNNLQSVAYDKRLLAVLSYAHGALKQRTENEVSS